MKKLNFVISFVFCFGILASCGSSQQNESHCIEECNEDYSMFEQMALFHKEMSWDSIYKFYPHIEAKEQTRQSVDVKYFEEDYCRTDCTNVEVPRFANLTTAKDTVINGALKLYVYEEWEESSVEKFAHRSTDNIQQIDIGEYGQMPLPIRFQIDRVETFAVFVNADSTEMLLASQCHGHFKNRYNAFYISPINEENRYILSNPICVHTEYAHFVTDSGCRIGMKKDELLSIKGTGYVVMENGDWRYSYLSTLDDPEIVEWCTQTGKGDLFWEFIFDGEFVACIFIACFN